MITITENDIRKAVKEVLESLYEHKLFSEYENKVVVSEGLTMTYAYPRIKSIINHKYNLKSFGCIMNALDKNRNNDMMKLFKNMSNKTDKTTRDTDSWFEVTLFFNDGIKCEYDEICDLIHTMNACGWYFAGLIDTTNNTIEKNLDKLIYSRYIKKQCKLLFYPKFNEEFKHKSINSVCYHICPKKVVERILEQGLTPHNNGRVVNHPERTYLFLNKPLNWKNIANNFRESGNNEKYCLLSVSMYDMIKKGIKFYYDANTMTDNPAIYTLEPISPKYINVIDCE